MSPGNCFECEGSVLNSWSNNKECSWAHAECVYLTHWRSPTIIGSRSSQARVLETQQQTCIFQQRSRGWEWSTGTTLPNFPPADHCAHPTTPSLEGGGKRQRKGSLATFNPLLLLWKNHPFFSGPWQWSSFNAASLLCSHLFLSRHDDKRERGGEGGKTNHLFVLCPFTTEKRTWYLCAQHDCPLLLQHSLFFLLEASDSKAVHFQAGLMRDKKEDTFYRKLANMSLFPEKWQ